jgi:alpha-glucosidase (family GH31 glycosyl hydrolase)
MDILVKHPNGDIYKGVVWPGVSAYPDCEFLRRRRLRLVERL